MARLLTIQALCTALGCFAHSGDKSPSQVGAGAVVKQKSSSSSNDIASSPGATSKTTTDSATAIILAIGAVAGGASAVGLSLYLVYKTMELVRRRRS